MGQQRSAEAFERTIDDVQVSGFYETVSDYISGTLHSQDFERVEDETPLEGNMNIQYSKDYVAPQIDIEEDSSDSGMGYVNEGKGQKIKGKNVEKMPRIKVAA